MDNQPPRCHRYKHSKGYFIPCKRESAVLHTKYPHPRGIEYCGKNHPCKSNKVPRHISHFLYGSTYTASIANRNLPEILLCITSIIYISAAKCNEGLQGCKLVLSYMYCIYRGICMIFKEEYTRGEKHDTSCP